MKRGFTLAELLIALAILGMIATFTIPKILNSQQNGQKKAAAKEVASMLSGAYSAYQLAQPASTGLKTKDLTPYMNYVRLETANQLIDGTVTEGSLTCNSTSPCLALHNGGKLYFWDESFGGTSAAHAIAVTFDPDGAYSGSTTGSGKGVEFVLYYNGRLGSYATVMPGTVNSAGPWTTCSSCDPDWFDWK